MDRLKKTRRPLKLLPKFLGAAALLGVLCIGFLGYLTPGMRINWETIATLCGF